MESDGRTRALIAVGASITANCQLCLRSAVSLALENGAGEQEIAAAIGVGRMVRKGAASKMDEFAASLNPAVPSAAGVADEGCGCGSHDGHSK